MVENNWLSAMQAQAQLRQVLETNQYTGRYGLSLTPRDAQLLAAASAELLRQERRIEFGGGILGKIIHEFCDSPYLRQDIYRDSLLRLQEIFYRYKNETEDEISDDELLHFMKEQFDGVCYGDLDYLEETCLDIFAQAIRAGYRGYIETEGQGEFGQFDPVPRWDRTLYLQALRDLCGWGEADD